MIKRIAHVCLSALDLDEAERFYCSGLGFKKVFEFFRDGKRTGFYLELAPGSYVEVFQRDAIDTQAALPIRHFCIEVDDIETVRSALIEAGYEATEKKLGADQSWQAWTTDPSGIRIEFHQYTDQSSQKTGKNATLG